MIRLFVLDYLLPILVSAGLSSFLLFILFARLVYDHLATHYHDMLSPRPTNGLHDSDANGVFMSDVWQAGRSGEWRRIDSTFWRGFFLLTMTTGGIMLISLFGLAAIFLFPRWWR
ncbi:hypothetical protein [Jeongeupia chitinilytica]|uniref:Uncharacterized protein n=1 Tax=Jeongeupia chitinilytica TaxID=1041641 RepID=A0ABQ3H089_9NEIS|nr:hypothetical protein [Jeongeupia chitinilytica]GHD60877.1 hypothetical protein GCM10007350_14640 [Jeongeupia chitinilytica]